ncbi:unnamed protein product [Darwinula stevensoni]|uniref:Uncharacterized protein n=1 Tax=Darwinula stevensoni TaxID=69355 RepID=A0A7R9FRR6_9CRUS|nr:unnamed protein product [Darwinula stevensoni]CAG0901506.1 unnamed protein product [Darwinula stevensoni]
MPADGGRMVRGGMLLPRGLSGVQPLLLQRMRARLHSARCEEAWCPPGFKCVMSQIVCEAPPGRCPEITHCIPEDHITCDDMTCVEGYHCIMQEMGCEDCYPYADCVPDFLRESSRDDLLRPPSPRPKMNLLQLMAGGRPLQPMDPRMLQDKNSLLGGIIQETKAKFLEKFAKKK